MAVRFVEEDDEDGVKVGRLSKALMVVDIREVVLV